MRRLDEIALSERDREAIADALRVLRAVAPVERIVLFGSKSRGDDDPESDIDLLVLTSRPLARAERRALTDALYPIELAHDVVFSLLVLAADEWESGLASVLPLHEEVEQQGAVA